MVRRARGERATLAVAVACLAGGCQYRDATSAEQAASVRQTLSAVDRARSVDPAVVRAVAVVIAGPGLAAAGGGGGDDVRGRQFAVRHTPGADMVAGAAVVVDRRGYLATAAHLVGGGDPILVVLGGGSGRAVVRPARVVYRGTSDFDFALLHVAGPLPNAMEWLPSDGLAPRLPLVGIGTHVFPAGPAVRFEVEPYAGTLLHADRTDGPDGPYTTVIGTAPTHGGDSGGPQYTVDGRLVAVLTAGRTSLFGHDRQSEAIRPDLVWLADTIENDQRTLAGAR